MPKAKSSAVKSKAGGKRKVAEESETSKDWSKCTVAQLKEECKNRGLETTGKKDELVYRIQEDDGGEEPVPKLVRQVSEGTRKAKEALDALAKTSTNKKRTAKPDSLCPLSGNIAVYDEFDCMLNQTNIANNNNKYYVIQLLEDLSAKNKYYLWTRWGRVGEPGANELKGPFKSNEEAEKMFKKKFKDKTKNDWDERANFRPFSGKYTLLEMGDETEEDVVDKPIVKVKGDENYSVSSMDLKTQFLISILFDDKTFLDAMKDLQLDVKKMPLGKLSKSQIAKGFDVLVDLENAIKTSRPMKELETLSSAFYTLIPHSFGRQRPPVIQDLEVVQAKKDVLIVLSDIELTQSMKKEETSVKNKKAVPNPLDQHYEKLKCNLTLLEEACQEYKLIETYAKNTGYTKLKNIWRVERPKEEVPFKAFDSLTNRRLLWHGTNIAVVAAILKEGLRIMPHSGGRVGKGLYFASELSKSSGYVGYTCNMDGVVFLNEVALGKEHHITMDDCSLTKAPAGFDSVVARGTSEPDPREDKTLTIDGKSVTIPQGKPIQMKSLSSSYFNQSEYLIYKENQVRIRYLLLINNNGRCW